MGLPVEGNAPPEDGAVSREAPLPESPGENSLVVSAWLVLSRREEPSNRRRDMGERKGVTGEPKPLHLLRRSVAGDARRPILGRAHLGERRTLRLPVQIIGG